MSDVNIRTFSFEKKLEDIDPEINSQTITFLVN